MDRELANQKYAAFRAGLEFQPSDISRELIKHSADLVDVCDLLAEATWLRDRADNDVKIAEADATNRLRATEEGGKPMSETKIRSVLRADRQVIKAMERAEDARREVGRWSSLLTGMSHKSSALKRTAELITAGYLSPNASYEKARERSDAAPRHRRQL